MAYDGLDCCNAWGRRPRKLPVVAVPLPERLPSPEEIEVIVRRLHEDLAHALATCAASEHEKKANITACFAHVHEIAALAYPNEDLYVFAYKGVVRWNEKEEEFWKGFRDP